MTQVDFYDKEQIDAKEIGAPDDAASSSGSLWARIKNAVARIISLETADTNNVKKTGTSTVTGDVQVPTTPATPTSVVNSAYVNDATDGVNNLLHKSGAETKTGILTMIDTINFNHSSASRAVAIKDSTLDISSSTTQTGSSIVYFDKNDTSIAFFYPVIYNDGTTALVLRVLNSNGTQKAIVLGRGDVI